MSLNTRQIFALKLSYTTVLRQFTIANHNSGRYCEQHEAYKHKNISVTALYNGDENCNGYLPCKEKEYKGSTKLYKDHSVCQNKSML